jgi:signal transduction histidine kinase
MMEYIELNEYYDEVRFQFNGKCGNGSATPTDLPQSAAALAQENASLRQQLLVERERAKRAKAEVSKELAQALHDGPVQLLTAAVMSLELHEHIAKVKPTTVTSQEITTAHALLQEANCQLRTMLFELRPLLLEKEGLIAALQLLLKWRQKYVHTARLKLEIETSDISWLNPQIGRALFNIAQEGLNNALKHARAHNITVQLKETPTLLSLVISDDGQGFNVTETLGGNYLKWGSMGLLNIQEQAQVIGAELLFESAPGQGTVITVTLTQEKRPLTEC